MRKMAIGFFLCGRVWFDIFWGCGPPFPLKISFGVFALTPRGTLFRDSNTHAEGGAHRPRHTISQQNLWRRSRRVSAHCSECRRTSKPHNHTPTSMPEELAITVRSEGRGLGFGRLWRKLSSAVRDRRLNAAARGKEMNTISIADAPVHQLGEKKWSSGTSKHVYADVSGELIDDEDVWIAYKPDSSASTSSPDSLLRTLPAHQWDASAVSVALNVTYKATHEAVVALDGLVSEEQRAELLAILRGGDGCGPVPPADRWDRRTIDAVGLAPTFGLRQSLLRRLQHSPPRAVLEIQSRLCQLYPEYTIAFLPETGEAATGRRTAFVANAATHGDSFQWHTDADPSSAMPGWHETHGVYTNGQPGRPLLVSLLVYLDEQWRGDQRR